MIYLCLSHTVSLYERVIHVLYFVILYSRIGPAFSKLWSNRIWSILVIFNTCIWKVRSTGFSTEELIQDFRELDRSVQEDCVSISKTVIERYFINFNIFTTVSETCVLLHHLPYFSCGFLLTCTMSLHYYSHIKHM